MSRYSEIDEARKLLELNDSATLEEIRKSHRRLIKKWHPDVSSEKKELCGKMTKQINDAYNCLMEYCRHYKFSFSKEEAEKYASPDEWWFKRFGSDPVWSSCDFSGKEK